MILVAAALKSAVSVILPGQEAWEVEALVVQSISLTRLSKFMVWSLLMECAYHYLMKGWGFGCARSWS
jgi:hypothetical protein